MDQEHHVRRSSVLKWTLIIGIVIVLNLFFGYAISLVYTAPDYNSYCPNLQVNTPPTTKAECIKAGGQWNETTVPQAPVAVSKTSAPIIQVSGSCNPNYTCQNNFEAANKIYERNVFVILVVLGVISILVGILLHVTEAVTIGLSLGGVLSLVIASIRYWSQAENILKVAILAAALIALIWIGIKKFQE